MLSRIRECRGGVVGGRQPATFDDCRHRQGDLLSAELDHQVRWRQAGPGCGRDGSHVPPPVGIVHADAGKMSSETSYTPLDRHDRGHELVVDQRLADAEPGHEALDRRLDLVDERVFSSAPASRYRRHGGLDLDRREDALGEPAGGGEPVPAAEPRVADRRAGRRQVVEDAHACGPALSRAAPARRARVSPE